MFSPVYEDVSALFGCSMPMSSFGTPSELQFPQPPHFMIGNANTTQAQADQQHQQQQQPFTSRATIYSLVDAPGVQMQRPSAATQQISMSGMPLASFDGAPILPYEIFMQHQQHQHQQQQHQQHQQQHQHQQHQQLGKPSTIQSHDGMRYFFTPSGGAPVMTSPGGPTAPSSANILQVQHPGATLYTLESKGSTTRLTSTPPTGGFGSGSSATNCAPSSSDYPFYTTAGATGFLGNGPLAMAPGGMGGTSVTPYAIQGPMPSASPRICSTLNGTSTAIAGTQHHSSSNTNTSAVAARRENQSTLHEMLSSKAVLEVFDPDFKFIYNVPTSCVVHLPPARLNITRLVLCRNYRPHESQSCAMGGSCKFVHADCNYTKLEAHPIHVNYIWRHETLCTYPRMPAGERLEVAQLDGPCITIASEMLLLTAGASAQASAGKATVSCCDSYENSGMCNCGERCRFIHIVHVDPNVQGDFKRAPRKREAQSQSNNTTNNASSNAISSTTQNGSSFTKSGEVVSGQARRSSSPPATEPQLLPPPPPPLPSPSQPPSRRTHSPETLNSSASNATVANGVRSNTAMSTPIEGILSTAASAKLQEAVAQQLRTAANMGAHPATPSFSISLTPFAIQTLTTTESVGTLLYLPRGASEATVLGPVGAGEVPPASP